MSSQLIIFKNTKLCQKYIIYIHFAPDADHREKKYKAHRQFGDRRGGVISARTYFYADEAKCDNQMETFINCIKASGKVSGEAIKKHMMLGCYYYHG